MRFFEKVKKLGKIKNIINAYNLEENLSEEEIFNLESHEILEILEKRLGILKTEKHNYDIISRRILKDYRVGKIGKFFLEFPEHFE